MLSRTKAHQFFTTTPHPLESSKCATKHRQKHLRIVTFVFCEENYGQILQAYALQRYIRDTYPSLDTKVIWGLPQAFSKKLYYFHRICGDSIYRFVRACKKRVLGSRVQESQEVLAMRKRRGFNTFKQSHIALHAPSLQHFILPQSTATKILVAIFLSQGVISSGTTGAPRQKRACKAMPTRGCPTSL